MSIPLYFNKTLLHKSFKWSSLISDPGWRSSPLKVTICSVAHGLQLQPFSRFWVLWSKTPLGNRQNHIRWVWNTLWIQKANNVNMLMVRTLLPFQVQSKSCLKVPVYSAQNAWQTALFTHPPHFSRANTGYAKEAEGLDCGADEIGYMSVIWTYMLRVSKKV